MIRRGLFVLLTIVLFACAQTPLVTPKAETATGCVKSQTANHLYQSEVDPKVIFEHWTEVPELRKGDFLLMEIAFRNPDINSDIPVALLVRQAGYVIGFSYLQNGEPKMFLYNSTTNCYQKHEILPEYMQEFLTDLRRVLGTAS